MLNIRNLGQFASTFVVVMGLISASGTSHAQLDAAAQSAPDSTVVAKTPQEHQQVSAAHEAQAKQDEQMAQFHQAQADAYRKQGLARIASIHEDIAKHYKALAADRLAISWSHELTAANTRGAH